MKKLKTLTWDDFLVLRQQLKMSEALTCLTELSEYHKNSLAMVQLGRAYHLGLYGLEKNDNLSMYYLHKSSHPMASYYLHIYHKYKQKNVRTDHFFLKALDYLNENKNHDYDKQTLLLQAIKLFEESATTCKIYESYYHLSQIDTKQRVKRLKMGAKLGDEQCQCELAKYYEAKHNYKQAWVYKRKYWKQVPKERTKHAIYDDLEKCENCNRLCMYVLFARYKANNDNLWWVFPKDIVKMIVQRLSNTKREDCWAFIF
jgi:hypothetical protein